MTGAYINALIGSCFRPTLAAVGLGRAGASSVIEAIAHGSLARLDRSEREATDQKQHYAGCVRQAAVL